MCTFVKTIFLSILLFFIAVSASAQQVEYDSTDNGYRHLSTSTTVVVRPEGSLYPISIGLNYYEGYTSPYYLRLYSRNEEIVADQQMIMLVFSDGTTFELKSLASNHYRDRLGLGKEKDIYDVHYAVDDEVLQRILTQSLNEVRIRYNKEWLSKTYKHNALGKWLRANHKAIEKKRNK